MNTFSFCLRKGALPGLGNHVLVPTAAKTLGYGIRHASKDSKLAVKIYTQLPNWRQVRDSVFPNLPKPKPVQPHSIMPKPEREELVHQPTPTLEYELPVVATFPTQLPLFVPHKPREREQIPLDVNGQSRGLGKRKTCIARAWLKPGSGQWDINGRPTLMRYFPIQSNRDILLHPFIATESIGQWDTKLVVKGGGFRAQAQASRMAIAHALANHDMGLRAPLHKAGYFKRDLRIVERKKPGQKKARKKFQWVRR